MKTEWDYTALATSYLKRPDYSPDVLDQVCTISGVTSGKQVCDIGAGVAHLTLPLLERNLKVVPVEPNDEMRKLGRERTLEQYPEIEWAEGTGEATGQADDYFDLVTFGSSFNVTDRTAALKETRRILKSRGWFVCMWNHRDLDDPLQIKVERAIKNIVPGYSYGARREDQTEIIESSGFFNRPEKIEGSIIHTVSAREWSDAWKSHATLQRQAGARFPNVIETIADILKDQDEIQVPYVTRAWIAQLRE